MALEARVAAVRRNRVPGVSATGVLMGFSGDGRGLRVDAGGVFLSSTVALASVALGLASRRGDLGFTGVAANVSLNTKLDRLRR